MNHQIRLLSQIMTSRHNARLRACSRRGFSLIEVMIASLVLMLVFISCITALQAGFRMVDNARMANLADQTIQSQIESIKLLHWGYIGGAPDLNSSSQWYFQSKQFGNRNLYQATSDGGGWINFLPQISSVVGNVNSAHLSRVTRFRMSVVDSTDPTTAAVRANVKRIKVEMQWRGLNGNQLFSREFETFYAKDGASDFYYTSFN
jgi:prepilin-type N-terminal cleavage/methylation domain-containing protein